MKYFTVEAKTYDEAVRKARQQYGDKLRIESRKYYVKSSFLGIVRRKCCEITCYVSESQTEHNQQENSPDPDSAVEPVSEIKAEAEQGMNIAQPDLFGSNQTVSTELLDYADSILRKNDFSDNYIAWVKKELTDQLRKALPDVPTKDDIQISIADKIASSIVIDHKCQNALSQMTVLLGADGSGKTTVCAKLAALFGKGKDGCFITCDDSSSAFEQASKLSNALNIPVIKGYNANMLISAWPTCRSKDFVLVDSVGVALSTLKYSFDFSPLEKFRPKYWLVLSATMKNNDISKLFSCFDGYEISGIVISKTDETSTVGNVISLCHDRNIPLIFVSDGRKIPKDFRKATVFGLLSKLNGFSIDFTSWASKEH